MPINRSVGVPVWRYTDCVSVVCVCTPYVICTVASQQSLLVKKKPTSYSFFFCVCLGPGDMANTSPEKLLSQTKLNPERNSLWWWDVLQTVSKNAWLYPKAWTTSIWGGLLLTVNHICSRKWQWDTQTEYKIMQPGKTQQDLYTMDPGYTYKTGIRIHYKQGSK